MEQNEKINNCIVISCWNCRSLGSNEKWAIANRKQNYVLRKKVNRWHPKHLSAWTAWEMTWSGSSWRKEGIFPAAESDVAMSSQLVRTRACKHLYVGLTAWVKIPHLNSQPSLCTWVLSYPSPELVSDFCLRGHGKIPFVPLQDIYLTCGCVLPILSPAYSFPFSPSF